MPLSDRHRRFLLIEQGAHAFLINLVLNALIAWLLLRGQATVPLWGETSMGVDLLITAVLLPFLMCQIVSRIIARQVASGKLPALEPERAGALGLHRRSITTRGLVLAAVSVLLAAAPLVWLLDLADAQPVAVGAFVGFKAVWAGTLALLVSPPMAWWALMAASADAPALAPTD